MKLTQAFEQEILAVMEDYWNSYFTGNLQQWASYLPDHYRNIGTTKEEIWNNKQDIVSYTHRVFDQMVGMADFRNKTVQIICYDPHVMVHELGDLYVKAAEGWIFYAPFRLSSLLEKTENGWKILHQHGSFPDLKAAEGEAFGLDVVKAENERLKKAVEERTLELERQKRELEIEAALERVRSRSMSMQKSEELQAVIKLVYDQLVQLNIQLDHAGFVVDYAPFGDWTFWIADQHEIPSKISHPYFDSIWAKQFNEAKQQGKAYFETILNFEEKNRFYEELLSYIPDLPKASREFYMACPGLGATTVLFEDVSLYIENFEGKPYTEEENKVLMRFGKVFQQTYTRFLDLQKAETQAREAQIEVALERTRTQSMLMKHSDEIKSISNAFHEQLIHLGIPSEFSYVWLPDEPKGEHQFWASWSEEENGETVYKSKQVTYPLDKAEPYTQACFDAWTQPEIILEEFIPPTEVTGFFEVWQELLEGAEKLKAEFFPEGIFYSEAYMRFGCFGINIRRRLSQEEKTILKRFSIEFERAYTRFLDLQKAEAQAREAQIELSLEKIRSKVSSMQESTELLDIMVSIRSEFVSLGHEAEYFWYMRWLPDKYEKAMTSGDGSQVGMIMTLPRHIHGDIPLVADWERGQEPTLVFPMDVETAVVYVDKMISLGDFELVDPHAPTLEDIRHIGGLTFVMARTSQGEIGYSLSGVVPNPPEEAVKTLARFAGVFDLAYARFEDLKKAERDLIEIKEAKKKAEEALAELKSAQAQLIQSEKMASLGELTAGIAHEIQNPLNFVNNFSEVSAELLDELSEELKKGDLEEADFILSDLRDNLTKINHHGKRAGSIVKGMLEHSRKSEGKKELVDLNTLADECLKLGFHGLRAKDKTFSADFKADLAQDLPEISVVRQDIGRVLLNLINNAFYAVHDFGKTQEPDFQPMVSIQTRMAGNQVEISVADNGKGVPEQIVDKIFQPFFTTKPTGEGTGLGLSLSYDIIKAHGGELTVKSIPNEGATFLITLPI